MKTQGIVIGMTSALLLGSICPGWATTLSVSNLQAQGQKQTLSVKVWPGYGLNVSFIATGEKIIKAWLDDPSHLAMDVDGSTYSSVVHLRKLKAELNSPLAASPDGATLLTVITESEQGRKLYQIRVVPAEGAPSYFAVNVGAVPELRAREMAQLPHSGQPPAISQAALPADQRTPQMATVPQPLDQPPERRVSFQPLPAIHPSSAIQPLVKKKAFVALKPKPDVPKASQRVDLLDASAPRPAPRTKLHPRVRPTEALSSSAQKSIDDANAAVFGLVVAHQKDEIKRGSTVWNQMQSAISWLRRGKTAEVAAKLAGVKLSTMQQVITWGQQRPGHIQS